MHDNICLMIRIHFICRGNVYRSRMAEAYALSLLRGKENVAISSSGIEANVSEWGDVDQEALEVLKSEDLENFLKKSWQRTTQCMLDEANVLVFMSPTVYEDARLHFGVDAAKSIVWNVPDKSNVYDLIKAHVKPLVQEVILKCSHV